MSTLYQEPVRAHYDDGEGHKIPCLFAGITSKDEAIIVQPDGKFITTSLDWVEIDWRYDDAADKWRLLEDMVRPAPDDES